MAGLKLVVINVLVFICLYGMVVAVFFSEDGENGIPESPEFDGNLVRALYPVYRDFDQNTALTFFADYDAPTTSYSPFVGYRRDQFTGTAVNISESGLRLSLGHSFDDAVWFLGGSTVWGTGVPDQFTIPSHYHQMTGESVLNLGESGYHSFQDLVQLQMLLVKGVRPKKVVAYGGFNDGYSYCQQSIPVPSHAYVEYFNKAIDHYRRWEAEGASLTNYKDALLGFFARPFRQAMSQSKVLVRENFDRTVPFREFAPKDRYLFCDDYARAKQAAEATVEAWMMMSETLAKKQVPFLIVLQPIASVHAKDHALDYLIADSKQAIVDEAASFERYYQVLKEVWRVRCAEAGNCEQLLDLSEIFRNQDLPVFIDACHIGPDGNGLVAKQIVVSLPKATLTNRP